MPLRSVVALGYPNYILEDYAGLVLSGGSWSATLPLNNVKSKIYAKKARTTNAAAASSQIRVNFPTARGIGAVAAAAHNLTQTATWRVRLYSAANLGGTLVYDSGTVAAWLSGYVFEAFFTKQAPFACVFRDPTGTGILSALIEFTDTTNPAGYIEIGRLLMTMVEQPSRNMAYGASIGYETGTTVEKALDETEYFDVKFPRRRVNFVVDDMTPDDAYYEMMPYIRDTGIDSEVIYCANPNETDGFIKFLSTFPGRMTQLNPIENPYFAGYKGAFTIREIV